MEQKEQTSDVSLSTLEYKQIAPDIWATDYYQIIDGKPIIVKLDNVKELCYNVKDS